MFLLGAAAPTHAARTTRVNDTVYRADGLPASGTLLISWPSFTTAAGEAVAAGRMNVAIGPNGLVDVALVPNTGSTPASYYTVVIKSDNGVSTTEYWTVPSSTSSTVAAVRSKVVPTSVAAQFVGRDYIDSAIASAVKDNTGSVTLAPSGSQVVNQPAGTSLQVNHAELANANGIRYADRFGSLQSAVNDAGTAGALVIPPGYSGTDSFSNSNQRPVLDLRRIGDFRGGRISVLDFGADPTGGYYPIANMASGSKNIAINGSGAWANPGLKAGQSVCMSVAGAASSDLCGHVVSYSSGMIVTDASASTTASLRGAWWGTDSSAAFQAAVNTCSGQSYAPYGGCELDVPPGAYILKSTITFPAVNGNLSGRITIKCPGGRNAGKLIWAGADQGTMFKAPAGSIPVEFTGCSFVSADYLASNSFANPHRAAIAIDIQGGTQHRIIDNRFNDLYEGLRMTSSWSNVVDHNYCYGAYNACFHNYNGGVAPVNATTFSNNELGFYHLHGLLSDSAGQGGSNGNFYFGNDFEGTASDTISDVDLNDNWGSFGPNRFETSGSQVPGWKALIYRGTYNKIDVTFCGSAMTIAGTDNLISCSGGASSAINDTGGFNTYFGTMSRSTGLTGGGAATATIFGGRRAAVYLDTPTFQMLGTGATDNPKITPSFNLISSVGGGFTGFSKHPTLSYGATVWPKAPANSTFQLGDQLLSNDPGYGPGGYRNNVAFWECVGGSTATCTFDGTNWGGTGTLYRSYLFNKHHAESSAVPASGTSSQGDLVWKTNPSGPNPLIGWSVTTAGTPGTFAPIYAIDPANPPVWGSTTPAQGTFTTVSATTAVTAPSAQFSAPLTDMTTIAGGPAFWCKADSQAYGDGASVTACADSAASPHNANSSGTAPIYKANITPTGKPVIRFSGVGYLQTAAFTLNQPSTICGVYSRATGYSGGALWDGRNLNSASHYFQGTTALGLYTNGDGTTNINGTVVNDGKFHVVCSVINNPASAVYVDGVQIASGAAGTANMGGVTIGAAGSGAVKATADIAEVVVFSSALSTESRQSVENYLTQKYLTGFVSVKSAAGSIVGQFDANGKLTSSGASFGFSTLAFSATPVFDASAANTFKITLTGNITSSTLVNVGAGQPLDFIICQDATGSRTMSWPANVKGAMTIGSTASRCSAQSFVYDGANAYATSSGVSNQ
jgi:hypothetical protein